ncbi:hypothetical protein UFOVP928_10 [uncultured Caudovirales phage]|uniref:Uncharacterized protein n=1 Tax=uncultured Caudovirales phage TaxID=2100421 RepID=A0A6J5PAQ0_9CAUD|nr:hypothetical protein UFOVP578_36 [uncultured Caudovirales phage]CAB4171657.1 hypothetical protein UFOVP928_10 [uncultured Caudovirales phage]CAB4183760.1 hypothetical protein UFOVP1098_6 [uncultured Caudovirales phage]CAB4200218.1 hypothetical protein UFOVP1353_27 [uncultured Caudovirales phage]CAB4214477.1 hypothetical protein UFOVP1458_39 [uncultured Caudovirales phage]
MKRGIDDIGKGIYKGGVALARRAAKKGVKKGVKAAKTAAGGAGRKLPPKAKTAVAASGDAARRKAQEAARQLELRSQRQLQSRSGQQQLIKEWGKLSGRQFYADEAAKGSSTVRSRMAEEARSRGIANRARGMGARQNADEAKAIADAAARKKRQQAYKEAGGRNSAAAKARRDSRNANRAKQVRKDIKKNKPK